MYAGKRYYIKFIMLFSLFLPLCVAAQLKVYEFHQVDSLQRSAKKNVIVFIHTDWCKYCAMMNNTTFKDKSIIQQMNENFYFIALNAEEKKDITFNGFTFKFKQTGVNTGIHELAIRLASADKKTSYPTLCFLNEKNEILYQHRDFIKAKQLATLLHML